MHWSTKYRPWSVVVLATLAIFSTALAAPGNVGSDCAHEHFPQDQIYAVQFETTATGLFRGVGVVKDVQASSGALTLDHEAIKGFMPAMIMMYRVQSPAVSRGLKVGDRIAFELDAKSYTILGAKLISPAKK